MICAEYIRSEGRICGRHDTVVTVKLPSGIEVDFCAEHTSGIPVDSPVAIWFHQPSLAVRVAHRVSRALYSLAHPSGRKTDPMSPKNGGRPTTTSDPQAGKDGRS